MTQSQRLAITVERRKRLEHFELRAGLLRIGSAAHCDVRLAPDEAAPESVLVQGHAHGVLLRRKSDAFAVALDGLPFSEHVVSGRARLTIGNVALSIELLAAQKRADQDRSLLKRVRRIALLLGIGVGFYVVLQDEPAARAFDHSVPTPLLFGGASGQACPHHDAATARAFGLEQLAAAQGKHERSVFSARDGVLAVRLYDTAQSCLAAAKDQPAADEARAARERLARTLQEDLRTHQVRLEWALERRRYASAARELAAIRELLLGRTDEHAQWIAAVARELRAVRQ